MVRACAGLDGDGMCAKSFASKHLEHALKYKVNRPLAFLLILNGQVEKLMAE